MFAEATDDEIVAFFECALLDEMLVHGTTALELKTGYGLSVEQELRGARLARRLADEARQTCSVTLLAAHAVPAGIAREDWVRIACDELIPEAARGGLADAVDVYVEDIAFSSTTSKRSPRRRAPPGLALRVHADQLGDRALPRPRRGSARAAPTT